MSALKESFTADSPVHNMNEKELLMEAYMGYLIGAITVIFLSILIFGYVKTTEIPPCMCHNGTHPAYEEDLCLDVNLSPAEINECETNGPIALAGHQTSNELFDGDCKMNMIIKKDKQTFFTLVCNENL